MKRDRRPTAAEAAVAGDLAAAATADGSGANRVGKLKNWEPAAKAGFTPRRRRLFLLAHEPHSKNGRRNSRAWKNSVTRRHSGCSGSLRGKPEFPWTAPTNSAIPSKTRTKPEIRSTARTKPAKPAKPPNQPMKLAA